MRREQKGSVENGTRAKRAPISLTFLLSPHFPRVLNAKLLLAALIFRSARLGMLATQARMEIPTINITVFLAFQVSDKPFPKLLDVTASLCTQKKKGSI